MEQGYRSEIGMATMLETLECPVCLRIYSHPRVLTNCGHSLCTVCIAIISSEPSMVECPICQVVTYYAQVEDLQPNFALNGIIEAAIKLKTDLDGHVCSAISLEDTADCQDSDTKDIPLCCCFKSKKRTR